MIFTPYQICLCIYCITILCGLAWRSEISCGLWGWWWLKPWLKSCPGVWYDGYISSTGVVWVYLSAGAEDGNRCQVEFCSDCLYRWMEPGIDLLYTLQISQSAATLSIASILQAWVRGWWKQRFKGDVSTLFCLAGPPDGALSDSEDENPEALQPPRPPRPLGHYSLCEQGQPESLLLCTPPASPREMDRSRVVINQPAPLSSPHQAGADTLPHSSDSVRRIIGAIIMCDTENELCLHADRRHFNMATRLFDRDIIS